jgi:hypothetical protein
LDEKKDALEVNRADSYKTIPSYEFEEVNRYGFEDGTYQHRHQESPLKRQSF